MASLAEMMNYADWTSKNSTAGNVAGTIESGVEGVFAGANAAQRQRRAQLDTTLKILDIHEKMQKMQLEAQRQKIETNIFKAKGLLPMDSADHAAAMDTAWGRLGAGKDPQYPNTPEGKLAQMMNTGDLRVGWSMKDGISVKINPTKGSKSPSESTAQARLDDQIQREDLKVARDIAVAKKAKTMAVGRDISLEGPIDPHKITVEPDEVMAALPIAQAMRKGSKTYAKVMSGAQAETPQTSPTVGLLAAVAAQRNRLLAQTAAMSPQASTKPILKPKSDAPRSIWDPAASVSNDEETDTEE